MTTQEKEQRPFPFENLQPTELAWLAGLLQAEANFTSDDRVRTDSNPAEYTPPPPPPLIKVDMIEEDVMEHVAKLVGQTVLRLKRETSAKNQVYRVTVQSREKTELLLRAILPYIVGEKNRSRIQDLISLCEAYHKWVAEGGKSNQARRAANSKKKSST